MPRRVRGLGLQVPAEGVPVRGGRVSANDRVCWDNTHNVHGVPISEDGTSKIKGWVYRTNDLKVPYIGIWVVPTKLGKYSAEGAALPEIIPLTAALKNKKSKRPVLRARS